MTRKRKIIIISINLLIVIATYLRMHYMAGQRGGWERNLYAIIITGSSLFFFYFLYTLLIRNFSKSHIDQRDFARLNDLEAQYISGEVEFYFSMEERKQVVFSILDKNMQEVERLTEREFAGGGHIVRFDTTKLPDGVYFYCLQTPNQKTMKKMKIQHVNLTV